MERATQPAPGDKTCSKDPKLAKFSKKVWKETSVSLDGRFGGMSDGKWPGSGHHMGITSFPLRRGVLKSKAKIYTVYDDVALIFQHLKDGKCEQGATSMVR